MEPTNTEKPTWGKIALGSFSAPDQMTFLRQVYGWMCIGLMVSAVISYLVATTPILVQVIIGNRPIFSGLLIAELAAVFYLATMVHQISAAKAALIFLLYAMLNGLTLSVIFLVYSMNSITSIFLITAGLFGIMTLYGYLTKRDLTTIGNFAGMLLCGLVLVTFVNLFVRSDMMSLILAYVGVFVFVILTAYDTQKLKWMYDLGRTEGMDGEEKEAIIGALTLYLDFVNLFFDLLRILGKRR